MKYIDGLPVPEVGDIVLVRSDLKYGVKYGHRNTEVANWVVSEMYELRGCYVTVSRVYADGQYEMKNTGGFGWTLDMLDLSEYEQFSVSVSKDDLMEFLI